MDSALPQLWIPVAVFAHIFAAAFLLPTLWPRLRRCFERWLPQPKPRFAIPALGTAAAASSAPPDPARLEWFGVGCSYRTADGPKIVLQGSFGSTGPGDMLALIGPSGSGKTTLLDILALQKTVGDVQGTILLNGAPYSRRSHGHLLAYVPQEEVFPPSLTCGEVLSMWTSLALPPGTTKQQRQQRMAEVLAAVGLQRQVETLVGGSLPGGLMLRGLSGGERKRLAVAAGLLQRPPLIFLDEPTTGLDSHSALNVMEHLAAMAAGGHAIIASIHQPRTAVWALFTHVVVLSQGLVMYAGPRRDLVPWMTESLGFGPYCPQRFGMAADWVMDLVNIGFRKPQRYYGRTMTGVEDLTLAASRFEQYYQQQHFAPPPAATPAPTNTLIGHDHLQQPLPHSDPSATMHSRAKEFAGAGGLQVARKAEGQRGPTGGDQRLSTGCGGAAACAARWFRQMRTLAWRELLLITRNPADVAGHALIFCWVGLVIGLVFYAQAGSPLSRVRQYTNALFVEVAAASLLPYIYMSIYTTDKRFFVADAAAGLYQPGPYYLSKVLVNLPFALLNTLTLSLLTYGMVGLRHGDGTHAEWGPPIVEHMVITSLSYLIATQVLHFAALIAHSQDAAFMVAIAWTALNLLVSNTLLGYKYMTAKWVSHLRYLSSMWYVVGGLVHVQFGGQEYSCASGVATEPLIRELVPELLPNNLILRQPFVQDLSLNPGPECVVAGDRIVKFAGAGLPTWAACASLAAYLLLLHAATFAALLVTQKRQKK